METQVKFVVLGHHSRRRQAETLAGIFDAHLLIDEANDGANAAHRRALEWAAQQHCRVIIMEDDALPVHGSDEMFRYWVNRFPDDFISFYLGTGRPPQYQRQIATKLIDADKHKGDYIEFERLIHGVCYSPPQHSISRILDNWDALKAADYAVGDAYGGRVIYPCYSLVDHADGDPVEQHPDNEPRTERRRAWRLAIFPVMRAS
ncbi:hypothetical protein SOASR030_02090 [Leminorella grimontii]|uniref:Glycosyltransferase n=1 Tax=Leminorella grimontii TaxID=82981 RepID=A0AAV5MXB5_9GAMM|nr:hypothetical protein [Leminorella grimontii]KFC95721.1 hypothetical protein GLGR_1884 [Leminorella grimontii ATCC 33999 = DSM 5078]GKX54097.1 hypothetical protein SOASR030_02090 [Leminorella grimontii]VFS60081.1 Uncharacterised protein [Leminorella grimontii]